MNYTDKQVAEINATILAIAHKARLPRSLDEEAISVGWIAHLEAKRDHGPHASTKAAIYNALCREFRRANKEVPFSQLEDAVQSALAETLDGERDAEHDRTIDSAIERAQHPKDRDPETTTSDRE